VQAHAGHQIAPLLHALDLRWAMPASSSATTPVLPICKSSDSSPTRCIARNRLGNANLSAVSSCCRENAIMAAVAPNLQAAGADHPAWTATPPSASPLHSIHQCSGSSALCQQRLWASAKGDTRHALRDSTGITTALPSISQSKPSPADADLLQYAACCLARAGFSSSRITAGSPPTLQRYPAHAPCSDATALAHGSVAHNL
jgi:hypothetical protein